MYDEIFYLKPASLKVCNENHNKKTLLILNTLIYNLVRLLFFTINFFSCSLFLLDKEHNELVAEVFEANNTSDEYLTEIRMPLNQGIVGQVATTGQMMNVKEVYK